MLKNGPAANVICVRFTAAHHFKSKAGKFRLRSKEIRFAALSSNYSSYLKFTDAKRNPDIGFHRLL